MPFCPTISLQGHCGMMHMSFHNRLTSSLEDTTIIPSLWVGGHVLEPINPASPNDKKPPTLPILKPNELNLQ